MPGVGSYVVVLVASTVATLVLTPIVRHVAVARGHVVAPDERHVHERPTPSLGGAAMLGGVFVGLLAGWMVPELREIYAASTELLGLVAAVCVIYLVGMLDDIRDISAPAKTAGMVLAGSIMSLAGISILVFRVPFFSLTLLSPDWSAFVTVVWVVALANAVNLIDGLDGLAAGIVAIAAGTFFAYSLQLSDEGLLLPGNPGALIAIVTLGVCLGFLPYNFHPAKIFMGDGGALMLGLLMAASTAVVGGRTSEDFSGQSFFFFAPIFIPVIILGVPIFDTVFAVLRRATQRTGVATADKGHLHHRLMRLGHGHRSSVLILWGWSLLLSLFVLYPTYTDEGNAFVPAGIAAFGLVLYTVLHPTVRRTRAEAQAAPPP